MPYSVYHVHARIPDLVEELKIICVVVIAKVHNACPGQSPLSHAVPQPIDGQVPLFHTACLMPHRLVSLQSSLLFGADVKVRALNAATF